MYQKRLDRRRKYYCVLDCETATLPVVATLPPETRDKIAIAKPLIYDLGWQIIDNKGRVYRKKKFLITEIFSVPAVFNTAYYASKRPLYLERLRNGEITLCNWEDAIQELVVDIEEVEAVGAYNSMFDFKKAIPFTDLYISNLYSENFYDWEAMQNRICKRMSEGEKFENSKTFEPDIFRFRNKEYKLFDLWGLSCEHLLNNDDYKTACVENGWLTKSGKYFKTSAETTFRFITEGYDFEEAHMAIDDAEIESKIFAKIHKKSHGKWTMGIIYFPFRILGRADIY